MVTLDNELDSLYEGLQTLVNDLIGLQARIRKSKEAWPSHQIRSDVHWHTREEIPPDEHIWASDGIRVWLIHGKGEPISPAATAVKFWTTACIPAPPAR